MWYSWLHSCPVQYVALLRSHSKWSINHHGIICFIVKSTSLINMHYDTVFTILALLTIKVKWYCNYSFFYTRVGSIIIVVKYWPFQRDVSYVHSITFDISKDCRMVKDFEQLPVLLFAGLVNGGLGESVISTVDPCRGVKCAHGGLQSRHSPHFSWWGHCWVVYNVADG